MEKYINEAIIGNEKVTASFTKKGELLRLLYPNRDYKQFIEFFHLQFIFNYLQFSTKYDKYFY